MKNKDYLPVYYQACKDASPISAGLDVFGLAYTIMPASIVCGISVAKSGRYRPQLWTAWALLLISTGLFSTLHEDTPKVASVLYAAIGGLGLGSLMSATFYPVLAPLPLSLNANAVAFFMFLRFFAQVTHFIYVNSCTDYLTNHAGVGGYSGWDCAPERTAQEAS